jgi:hypothetical protein
MDTYVHPRIWGFDRKDFVETKDQLMHRSEVLATKGREGNMEEMQAWYQEQGLQIYNPQRPELKTYTRRSQPQPWAAHGEEQGEIPALPRHPGGNGNSAK